MECYAPLIIPEFALQSRVIDNGLPGNRYRTKTTISEDEVDLVLTVSAVNVVLIRPEISKTQVDTGEQLIQELIPMALRLRPGLRATRNIHQCIHIPGDIRAHGPVYCHWCFAGERFGKCVKNDNSNGRVIESTAINARLKASTAGLVQRRLAQYAHGDEEKASVVKMETFSRTLQGNDRGHGSSASELFDEFQSNLRRLQTDMNDGDLQGGVLRARSKRFQLMGRHAAPYSNIQASVIAECLTNSASNTMGYIYVPDDSEQPRGLNTFFIQHLGIRHTKLDAYNKWFVPYASKADGQGLLSSFRDRLAIIQSPLDVFRCMNADPALILIESLWTVKVSNYIDQSRDIHVVLGRHAVRHSEPSVYPYHKQ